MATHWPWASRASSSSATIVPAPHDTVISAGWIQSMPGRRADDCARPATGPPRVPSPVIVTGSVGARPPRRSARQIHAPSATALADLQVAAPGRARQHLAGVGQPARVERRPQRGLRGEVDRREHQRHQVALLEADAVLAAEHAAGRDRDAHDLLAGGVHPLHDARLAAVVDEQRVEVAVAGVEHVEHEQVVAGGDLVHLAPAPPGSWARGTTVSCR